jgi:hypothetical protein
VLRPPAERQSGDVPGGRRRHRWFESANAVAAATVLAARVRVDADQVADAGRKRKFTAPRKAAPASSAIDAQIIERFVAYQHEAAARVRSLEGRDLAAVIMTSPFVSFITYSVLDGCRLIVTHERRHFEQARRVTREPRFPP